MATRGRKPVPTALKVLEGNPGKRPLNSREPKPEKKAPTCPAWLEPEAKKEWKRLAKGMEKLGILTEMDRAAFAAYCQSYARWKEAEQHINEDGSLMTTPNGYQQQSAWVSIANNAMKSMSQFASQFGLNPSARSRIIAGNEDRSTVDEMEALLGGGR